MIPLLANIFRNNSFISKIEPQDKKLLEKTVRRFKQTSSHYEDSWGYIIQATRYGGFKWHDPSNGALIFFGRKSLEDDTLIIPNFFAQPKYLINAIQVVAKGEKVILKNINQNEEAQYLNIGFRRYSDTERWSTLAKYDDQTFPQLIVDLDAVAKQEGKHYHNLRKALRKDPNALIRPYIESDKNGVLKLFAFKDGTSINSINFQSGMYYASHIMYPDAEIDRFVILDKSTNSIVGFTATSDINAETTAFVSMLFNASNKIASIWGIYQTMIIKHKNGLKKINLGGCESLQTNTFMRRNLHPTEEIYKTHLIYDSKYERSY